MKWLTAKCARLLTGKTTTASGGRSREELFGRNKEQCKRQCCSATMFLSEKVVGSSPTRGAKKRKTTQSVVFLFCFMMEDLKGRSKQTVRWTVCPSVAFPQKSKSNSDDFFGQMWASVPTITVNTVNSLVSYRLRRCSVGSLRGARFRGKMKKTPQNAVAKACVRKYRQACCYKVSPEPTLFTTVSGSLHGNTITLT